MAMAANRTYGQQAYPSSPAPTTASSLNYSQYGGSSFAAPQRHATTSVSSSSYNGNNGSTITAVPPRNPLRSQTEAGGLRVPGGSKGKGESKEVAKVHWMALRDFLREWLEKGESGFHCLCAIRHVSPGLESERKIASC